jgi:hypothetical protein
VVIYQRFDFTEMVKRSLGAEWRRPPYRPPPLAESVDISTRPSTGVEVLRHLEPVAVWLRYGAEKTQRLFMENNANGAGHTNRRHR